MFFRMKLINFVTNTIKLILRPRKYQFQSSEQHNLCYKGIYAVIIFSQLQWSIEFKLSQVVYLLRMLRSTNMKKNWSLTNIKSVPVPLKAVDTIGNCQRLAFTVCVPQYMHKITNLWKFELNRSSKLRNNSARKFTLVSQSCVRL